MRRKGSRLGTIDEGISNQKIWQNWPRLTFFIITMKKKNPLVTGERGGEWWRVMVTKRKSNAKLYDRRSDKMAMIRELKNI